MEILILVLLIALNGVLAMSEIAVVSSRKVRLEHSADRGNLGARAALLLAESPTRFLSTVQVGITLIGIFSGAFGEAAIAPDLTAIIAQNPRLAPYSHLIATTVVVLAITYLSLVIGELAPKRLALNNPEKIASVIAPPMRVLAIVTAPLVHFLSFSTDVVVRLFGVSPDTQEVTEEEIKSMIEKGTAAGVFHEKERELVERIFRMGDQRVSALMVPHGEIAWLEANAPAERVRVAVAASSHSHFPVCRGGLKNILGVVHLKDMVKSGLLTQAIDLPTLARTPMFVPETMPVLPLLEKFRKAEQHIAFIHDEYGELAGLITLNDIVEGLLGHMARHGDDTEPMAYERPDGSWLLDGGLPVGELREIMGADELPGQERTSFHTLAGFIMTYLGRVPRTGDQFAYDRYKFEVIDMDRHRIDKVLLSFTGGDDKEKLLDEAGE